MLGGIKYINCDYSDFNLYAFHWVNYSAPLLFSLSFILIPTFYHLLSLPEKKNWAKNAETEGNPQMIAISIFSLPFKIIICKIKRF